MPRLRYGRALAGGPAIGALPETLLLYRTAVRAAGGGGGLAGLEDAAGAPEVDVGRVRARPRLQQRPRARHVALRDSEKTV